MSWNLKKLSKSTDVTTLMLIMLKTAERTAAGRWKSFFATLRTAIYALMVVRIGIAIYMKVNMDEHPHHFPD